MPGSIAHPLHTVKLFPRAFLANTLLLRLSGSEDYVRIYAEDQQKDDAEKAIQKLQREISTLHVGKQPLLEYTELN